jgi:hypothetical protein
VSRTAGIGGGGTVVAGSSERGRDLDPGMGEREGQKVAGTQVFLIRL